MMASPRPAQEVIDAAIRENRLWEYLCFGLTLIFALTGVAVLVLGAVRNEGLVALSGAVAGSLFWPALRAALAVRRENMAIRLLEAVLAEAKTAKQAAEAIRDYFTGQFGKGKDNGALRT